MIWIKLFENFDDNDTNIKNNAKFIKWFGDSKVIDSKGSPLVVYHGSKYEFDVFYEDSFFTDDYYNADGYASGEHVYEVYLSIKKPFILDCNGRKWDDLNTHYGTSTTSILGRVDRTKYDGVIFTNIKDSWIDDVDYQEPSTVYVAFTPKQVKSVENDGTFDIDDNNIYS